MILIMVFSLDCENVVSVWILEKLKCDALV